MTNMIHPDPIACTLGRLLDSWREAEIRGLVLRGYESLPATVGNDLDVLIERNRFHEFESLLLKAAEGCGLRRFARIERSARSPVAHRFYDPKSARHLGVDLFVDLNWKGLSFLDAEVVLDGRLRGEPVDVPRPAHEAAASLFSKILHGVWVRSDRSEHIRQLVQSDEGEFIRVLERAFGTRIGSELLARVRDLELASDARLTRRARQALFSRAAREPAKTIKGLMRNARRTVGRVQHPTGVFVVLLGPDGSGKSSLAAPLADRIAGQIGGVRGSTFHWKPLRLLRRGSGNFPIDDPHGRPARSAAISRAYLLGHWIELAIGAWSAIQPRLIRGVPVIGERYCFDLGLDPRRYRLDLPDGVGAGCPRMIRSPDITLCLLADAGTFQSRKQEVSFTDTREQILALERFAERESTAIRVNAAEPFEQVLHKCQLAVLDWMASRDENRRRSRMDSWHR